MQKKIVNNWKKLDVQGVDANENQHFILRPCMG